MPSGRMTPTITRKRVGGAMGHNAETHYQVNDLMPLSRIVALVDEG
jgi:hypothetical protein